MITKFLIYVTNFCVLKIFSCSKISKKIYNDIRFAYFLIQFDRISHAPRRSHRRARRTRELSRRQDQGYPATSRKRREPRSRSVHSRFLTDFCDGRTILHLLNDLHLTISRIIDIIVLLTSARTLLYS